MLILIWASECLLVGKQKRPDLVSYQKVIDLLLVFICQAFSSRNKELKISF